MSELRIPLDPLNPGQFFACCGLIELFDLRGSAALSHFAINAGKPRQAEFVLSSEQVLDIGESMRVLRTGRCSAVEDGGLSQKFMPTRLKVGDAVIELDWWLNAFRNKPSALLCWSGRQTPASILEELIRLLPEESSVGLLRVPVMTTKRFSVDPRSAWKPLDLGFSPNDQDDESTTFAATEVLAALGLQGFRPTELRGARIRYAAWREPLPRAPARLACASPWDGLSVLAYEAKISDRGQGYKFFEYAQGASDDY